jgi:hypothetical protein
MCNLWSIFQLDNLIINLVGSSGAATERSLIGCLEEVARRIWLMFLVFPRKRCGARLFAIISLHHLSKHGGQTIYSVGLNTYLFILTLLFLLHQSLAQSEFLH